MTNLSKKVEVLRINGQITKEMLIEMGTDPDLEGYLTVCRWKGDRYSVGWCNMTDQKLAHGLAYMDHQVKRELFGDM